MANWYAAHLIMYVKLKEHPQNRFTVWENVVLLKANSVEEAFEKAEKWGRDDAADDPTFRWGGKPARWVFAGVRKLTSCVPPNRRPGDGTEITYTEIQVKSEKSVFQLVNGDPVPLRYVDPFPDERTSEENLGAATPG